MTKLPTRIRLSAKRVLSGDSELSREDRWGLIGITSVVLALAAQAFPVWLVVVVVLPIAFGTAIVLDLSSDRPDPGADVQGPAPGWPQSDAEPPEPGVVREVFVPLLAAACFAGAALSDDDATGRVLHMVLVLFWLYAAGAGIRSRLQNGDASADDDRVADREKVGR